MALTIKDILKRNYFNGTKIAAGGKGIGTAITWVNVMDILDSPKNLKEGELLITTAYDLENEPKYHDIIPRLKSCGIAGLVIQVGFYIDHIPKFILTSADENNFPVLDMPHRYHFSDITHILLNEINREFINDEKAYIDYNYFEPSIRRKLFASRQLSDDKSGTSYIFAITPVGNSNAEQHSLKIALAKVQSFLTSCASNIIYESNKDGQTIICLTLNDKSSLHTVYYDLQIQLTFLSESSGVDLYVGIDSINNLDNLKITFDHLVSCLSALNDISAKRGVCAYENLTFIKMFGKITQDNSDFVEKNHALQTLMMKDRNSNTNYVQTVRIYLAENCNMTHTAERLFVHRHTMMNRIQTITELCGIDFNDYYTRIYLSMALLIHDYYAL